LGRTDSTAPCGGFLPRKVSPIDDFEQGAAQCLVEMQACQWENQQVNRSIDILGIVTNGNAWAFYQLTTQNQVYATDLYALSDVETVLGWLQYVFDLCDRNLGNA
jgi:hypothetical protein